jgi:small conductance mechanosensitive channel
VDKAMEVALNTIKSDSRVLADPAPEVMIVALADSSVNINMRCWVNGGDYWGVLFGLNHNAKKNLDAAGISIPFPQRDVHIIEQKAG